MVVYMVLVTALAGDDYDEVELYTARLVGRLAISPWNYPSVLLMMMMMMMMMMTARC